MTVRPFSPPTKTPAAPTKGAAVTISTSLRRWRIDKPGIKRMATHLMESLGVADHRLDIAFIGPKRMRQVNQQWRGKDRSTDVLSFPQCRFRTPLEPGRCVARARETAEQPTSSPMLGDIIISMEDAARNAASDGGPVAREVGFLIVHGLLHLGGHDHERPAERRRMFAAQEALMKQLENRSSGPMWRRCVRIAGERA